MAAFDSEGHPMNAVSRVFRPFPCAIRAAIFAFGFGVPLIACAELSNDTLLGPGLRWRPVYDGSASQHVEVVPVIRYLGQPLFARSTQGNLEGGLRFELAPGLHAGAQLAYESGRQPNDADFLKNRNVSGINRGASYGIHIEWDHKFGPMPITLLARAAKYQLRAGRPGRSASERRGFPGHAPRARRVYAIDMGKCQVEQLFLWHYATAVHRDWLAGIRCGERLVV